MIKERAMELVAALRSGKYKQGLGKLRPSENEYCCLGVASDISNVGHWKKANHYYYYANENENRISKSNILPCVQNYFGFKSNSDIELAILNDCDNFDFNQIADFIETHWEKL